MIALALHNRSMENNEPSPGGTAVQQRSPLRYLGLATRIPDIRSLTLARNPIIDLPTAPSRSIERYPRSYFTSAAHGTCTLPPKRCELRCENRGCQRRNGLLRSARPKRGRGLADNHLIPPSTALYILPSLTRCRRRSSKMTPNTRETACVP